MTWVFALMGIAGLLVLDDSDRRDYVKQAIGAFLVVAAVISYLLTKGVI